MNRILYRGLIGKGYGKGKLFAGKLSTQHGTRDT